MMHETRVFYLLFIFLEMIRFCVLGGKCAVSLKANILIIIIIIFFLLTNKWRILVNCTYTFLSEN